MTYSTKSGMSLIEILIVVAVFAILGVLTTRAVVVTLKGAKKSGSQIKVKENINYALSVMERQIRSAEEIIDCPNPDTTTISYVSLEGETSSFSCILGVDDRYISSGSGRLTSDEVSVDSCLISCQQSSENHPQVVSISVTASSANSAAAEAGTVDIETQIVSRNF